MEKIATTGGGQSATALLQSMIDTFKKDQVVHPEDKRTVRLSPRAKEAQLTPAALLDPNSPNGMKPIALFNRLDQAPQDWKYCGEHRIVYAKNKGGAFDRFFLIFEAAVRNPRPQDGIKGCHPVSRFWDDIGRAGFTSEQAAKRLETFYYQGLDVDGDGKMDGPSDIPAVIHADHFGTPFGQIRVNMFMQQPWELREWLIDKSLGAFKMNPVQNNPEPFLYKDTVDAGSTLHALIKPFHAELLLQKIASLTAVETGSKPLTERNIVTSIGADFGGQFDGFSSDSQNNNLSDPKLLAGPQFKSRIQSILNAAQPDVLRPLPTADQLLNRAGIVSCAGCHEVQNSANIAPPIGAGGNPVQWPPSLGFVHVDEASRLSPALMNHLLPHRCENLQDKLAQKPSVRSITSGTPSAAITLSRDLSSPLVIGGENGRAASQALMSAVITEERKRDRMTPGAFTNTRQSH